MLIENRYVTQYIQASCVRWKYYYLANYKIQRDVRHKKTKNSDLLCSKLIYKLARSQINITIQPASKLSIFTEMQP
jgi:hypothetical protein